MLKITPNLWFDNQAEDAAKFYTSIFKDSRTGSFARYSEAGAKVSGRPKGSVMTVRFELAGQPFMALNGGPELKFSEAVSFVVDCPTQEEIDYFWEKLGAGGDPQAQQCGWLKDKFGVSWQIVPVELVGEMMGGDSKGAERAMQALLPMKKLDIAALKRAYEGGRGGT